MTIPTIVTDFSNPNLQGVMDIDYQDATPIDPNLFSGASAIYLGAGYVLTAAHNFAVNTLVPEGPIRDFQFVSIPISPFSLVNRGVTVLEGTPMATNLSPINDSMGVRNGNVQSWGSQLYDTAVFQVSTPVNPMVENANPRMLIYSDPDEASGTLYIAGYPGLFGGETLYEDTGTLIDGQHISSNDYLYGGTQGFSGWNVDGTDFAIRPGMSGSGVWLTPDDSFIPAGQYLIGTLSGNSGAGSGLPGSRTSIEDMGGVYNLIAAYIFGGLSSLAADLLANEFGTHVLISDADGVANGQVNNFIQGTGFNEDIYINSSVSIGVDGGGGADTVYYTGSTSGITFDLTGGVVFAERSPAIIDNLVNIDRIQGSSLADTWVINSLLLSNSINLLLGNSNVPILPQGEVFGEGAEVLSMEDGTEDTLVIGQALLDAGAAVTYLSEDGSGVVWLESGGVTQRVSYTGIYHVPQQDPADYFWGTSGLGDVGASVGLGDVGDIIVDLSGVAGAITDTLLSGVSLWNLVDSIEVGAGDVTLDLGAFGINTYDASELIGRSPNNLSSGQIISVEGHGSGAAGPAANDNFSCAALAI